MSDGRNFSALKVRLEERFVFPAGIVTLVVVHREFTEAALDRYAGRPGVDELLAKIRNDGYYDRGASVYVNETSTDRDYLRFDCLQNEPHYHYHHLYSLNDAGTPIELEYQKITGHADSAVMNGYWHQVPFDSAANGDIRSWTLDRLHHRLPEMLTEAGGEHLVGHLDQDLVDSSLRALEPVLFATSDRGGQDS